MLLKLYNITIKLSNQASNKNYCKVKYGSKIMYVEIYVIINKVTLIIFIVAFLKKILFLMPSDLDIIFLKMYTE